MIIINDCQKWNTILKENFLNGDIYFKYQYFKLYERHYGAKPEAIFWEDSNLQIFWTHLVRDISKLGLFKDSNCYDLTTPYGYGGPLINIINNEDINVSIINFFEEYCAYAKKENYITEFIRFHPFFTNKLVLKNLSADYLNDIIFINLSDKLDDIWKNMKKGHRYSVRKSIENDCRINFITEPSPDDINKFNEMYKNTMSRNKASSKYYFSNEFIGDHFKLLDTLLVEAVLNGDIIGTSLFLLGDDTIHYHLSGSETCLNKVFPSHLMLFEVIKWAKERKFERFVLGGGRGSNDSLFQFKKGFSKSYLPFYVSKITFDNQTYNKLTVKNPNHSESNEYFPKYRFGFDKDIL